jgi:hypothetical protein
MSLKHQSCRNISLISRAQHKDKFGYVNNIQYKVCVSYADEIKSMQHAFMNWLTTLLNRLSNFPSPAGMSQTKLSQAGNN